MEIKINHNRKHSLNRNKIASLTVFLFLVIFNSLSAESTYGYCSVKESKNGKDLYQLYGNTFFESKAIEPNFHQIIIQVFVQKKYVYDDQQILAKAKLFNKQGTNIGVVITDFTPYKFINELDSMYEFEFSGIIPLACINPSSIPEIELNKILMHAKQNASIDTFYQHLKKFNYLVDDSNSIYKSFIIYEPNFLLQTKEPRILIIFYKGELISIFYSRNVVAKLYDSIEMGKEYKLIYNSKFTENTKADMINIFKKKMENQ